MSNITSSGIGLTSALDPQAIERARSAKLDPDKSKIDKTAKEFESLLLGHWLEQAQQAFASVPGADDESGEEGSDPGKSQFQSLGMQSLAQSITKSGGLGIAKMISKQLMAHPGTVGLPGGPVKEDSKPEGLQVPEK